MRNLKRALSLGLASAMVLGTMAFSASAATVTFNDIDQVKNQKAVELVSTIGLMDGDDEGNFNPDTVVTRAEMAVICTRMLHGLDLNVAQFNDANVFDDMTDHWALAYVNIAASLGIVAGVGDNNFNPNGQVTTAQAMVMVMRTLGYFQSDSEFGSNWELAVTRQATSLGLFNEKEDGELPASAGLVRENVAAIAFRALTECVQVDYNQSFGAYYNKGSSMAYGVDNSEYKDTLGYQKFDKLFAYDSVDDFDRPAVTWMHNGAEIGTYATEANYTFTEQKTIKEIYNTIGTSVLNNEDYARGIYIDGELLNGNYKSEELNKDTVEIGDFAYINSDSTTIEGINEILNNTDTTPFLETGAGVLTEIYIIPPDYSTSTTDGTQLVKKGQVVISMIHTYLAEVTYVTESDGEYTLELNYFDGTTYEQEERSSVLNSDFMQYATINSAFNSKYTSKISYEKGEVVMVNVAQNSSGDKMEVVDVNRPEIVEGVATASRLEPNVEGGSWLAVDGETFYYAHSMRGNLTEDFVMAPVENTDITVYLDSQGLVLGYEAEVAPKKYLYVEDRDGSSSMGGSGARVTLSDGTEKVITVTQIDGYSITSTEWNKIPTNGRYLDEDDELATANENVASGTSPYDIVLENRIYGYNELSDGTYELLTDIRESAVTSDDNKGVLPGITVGTGPTYSYTRYALGSASASLNGIPDKLANHVPADAELDSDTMFIFTSVFYDHDDAYYDDFVLANNPTSQENKTITGTTYNNVDLAWTFKIESGVSSVNTMETYESPVNGNIVTNSTGNHAFYVDNSTVFIDVVGNQTWVGHEAVDNMKNGDLNMQVVFGGNGIADVVFINHGAPTYDSSDYFIVLDNSSNWKYEDGVNTYTYTVYINGVAEEIVSKDKELTDNDGKKLVNNHLYFITETDDEYVYNVRNEYSYIPYANTAWNSTAANTIPGQGPTYDLYDTPSDTTDDVDAMPVSALDVLGDNMFVLERDDWFRNAIEESDVGFSLGAAYDTSSPTFNRGEDVFSFTDDTVFVVLEANGVTTDYSTSKYSIRVGSADDMIAYGNANATWVDVIKADEDKTASGRNPKAELVVIVKPYVTDTVIYGDMTYFVQAHDTFNEPTLGETATAEEIAAWYAWKEAGSYTYSTDIVPTDYSKWFDGLKWDWESKAYSTDGTTADRAFILEGWLNTNGGDISSLSQSEIAKEVMLQFAAQRGMTNVTVEDFVLGGSATATTYGAWNAKLVGVDSATGGDITVYVRLPFAKELEYAINFDYDLNGYGVFYVDFSGRTDISNLSSASFTNGIGEEWLEGVLTLSSTLMSIYDDEAELAKALLRAWADQLVTNEKTSGSNRFNYVHVTFNEDLFENYSASSFEDYLADSKGDGRFAATFTYYKDAKNVTSDTWDYLDCYGIDFNEYTADNMFVLRPTDDTDITNPNDPGTGDPSDPSDPSDPDNNDGIFEGLNGGVAALTGSITGWVTDDVFETLGEDPKALLDAALLDVFGSTASFTFTDVTDDAENDNEAEDDPVLAAYKIVVAVPDKLSTNYYFQLGGAGATFNIVSIPVAASGMLGGSVNTENLDKDGILKVLSWTGYNELELSSSLDYDATGDQFLIDLTGCVSLSTITASGDDDKNEMNAFAQTVMAEYLEATFGDTYKVEVSGSSAGKDVNTVGSVEQEFWAIYTLTDADKNKTNVKVSMTTEKDSSDNEEKFTLLTAVASDLTPKTIDSLTVSGLTGSELKATVTTESGDYTITITGDANSDANVGTDKSNLTPGAETLATTLINAAIFEEYGDLVLNPVVSGWKASIGNVETDDVTLTVIDSGDPTGTVDIDRVEYTVAVTFTSDGNAAVVVNYKVLLTDTVATDPTDYVFVAEKTASDEVEAIEGAALADINSSASEAIANEVTGVAVANITANSTEAGASGGHSDYVVYDLAGTVTLSDPNLSAKELATGMIETYAEVAYVGYDAEVLGVVQSENGGRSITGGTWYSSVISYKWAGEGAPGDGVYWFEVIIKVEVGGNLAIAESGSKIVELGSSTDSVTIRPTEIAAGDTLNIYVDLVENEVLSSLTITGDGDDVTFDEDQLADLTMGKVVDYVVANGANSVVVKAVIYDLKWGTASLTGTDVTATDGEYDPITNTITIKISGDMSAYSLNPYLDNNITLTATGSTRGALAYDDSGAGIVFGTNKITIPVTGSISDGETFTVALKVAIESADHVILKNDAADGANTDDEATSGVLAGQVLTVWGGTAGTSVLTGSDSVTWYAVADNEKVTVAQAGADGGDDAWGDVYTAAGVDIGSTLVATVTNDGITYYTKVPTAEVEATGYRLTDIDTLKPKGITTKGTVSIMGGCRIDDTVAITVGDGKGTATAVTVAADETTGEIVVTITSAADTGIATSTDELNTLIADAIAATKSAGDAEVEAMLANLVITLANVGTGTNVTTAADNAILTKTALTVDGKAKT